MKKKFSSFFRIDESVFLSVALIAGLSLFILAFRYKNNEPCLPIRLIVLNSDFREGSPISFRAETKNGKKYEWDFGDNTKPESFSSSAIHTYKKPGLYTVVLTVNGKCDEIQNITIKEAPVVDNIALRPDFFAPDSAFVGEPVTFKDNTPEATAWEWRFGENGSVDATKKEATYIYLTPGYKKISLKINGRNDRVGETTIYVKEKIKRSEAVKDPPSRPTKNERPVHIVIKPDNPSLEDQLKEIPPLPKEKAPDITTTQMSDLLDAVVVGEKQAGDFSPYLCEHLDMPVIYNGTNMTFSQMCAELRKFKRLNNINRPTVNITRYASTGCITNMTVTVTTRTLLNRTFSKRN